MMTPSPTPAGRASGNGSPGGDRGGAAQGSSGRQKATAGGRGLGKRPGVGAPTDAAHSGQRPGVGTPTDFAHPGKRTKPATDWEPRLGAARWPRILTLPVVVLALVVAVLNALYWRGRQFPDDWASLWIAGTLVRNGDAEHIYDFDPVDFASWAGPAWGEVIATGDFSPFPHPFVHLPGAAYLLAPFTGMMSFSMSAVLLTAVSGACLPILVSASWALWSRREIPLPALLAITVVAWYSTAFQVSSTLGQTSPIIVCLTVCGIVCAPRRPVCAGILLGCAGAVKLTPLGLVVLMFLFRRYRRGAVVGAIVAALAMLFSLVAGGAELFRTWLSRLSWISERLVVAPPNRSLGSAVMRNEPFNDQATLVIEHPPLWLTVLPMAVAALLFAAVVWAAWRNRRWAEPLILVGAYSIATMASSIMWNHYLLVCMPLVVGIGIFAARLTTTLRNTFMVLGLMATLLLFPPLNEQAGVDEETVGLLVPWADLAAIVALIGLLVAAALLDALPMPGGSQNRPPQPRRENRGVPTPPSGRGRAAEGAGTRMPRPPRVPQRTQSSPGRGPRAGSRREDLVANGQVPRSAGIVREPSAPGSPKSGSRAVAQRPRDGGRHRARG